MSAPMGHGDEPRYVSEEARELIRGLETVSNDLAALATFIRTAETMRTEAPDAATEQKHLAAIAAETARLRTATPAPSAQRSTMRGVLRSRWFKGAAIGVAAVVATSGLAAARMLPAPAQNVVASVADAIGIDIPRAEDPPGQLRQDDPLGDADGDGIPNGEDPQPAKVMDGLDHDGDGVPDDSGNRAKPSTPPGQDADRSKPEKAEKPDTPAGEHVKTPRPEKTPKPATPADGRDDAGTNNSDGGSRPTDPGPPAGAGRPSPSA